MNLQIKKHKRNSGKFFQKSPYGFNVTEAKQIALLDISKYVSENNDFGDRNYLHIERIVLFSIKNNKPFINI
jgi:hypothetical protein